MRLTKKDKSGIVGNVIKKTMDQREEALKKKKAEFAHDAYCYLYDEKTRDLMDSLPKGFLAEKTGFRIFVNGQIPLLYLETPKRFPHDSSGGEARSIKGNKDLVDRYNAMEREANAIDKT